MVLGLALYLIACAALAKRLRDQNATFRTRQLRCLATGVVAVAIPVVFGGNVLSYVFGAICGTLGYLTVVYRPKWIVGNR